MKLSRIYIKRVRGIESGVFPIEPVTVLSGPNGAGKTSVLGSVLFALTGRFPGLPANAAGAALMERDGGKGFVVTLGARDGDIEVVIRREFKKSKLTVALTQTGEAELTGKAAEARIEQLFGDVTFMASALDPEGSLWGLSREKRKAWASALCQGAAAWTTDRLVKEVGPAELDWDPEASKDAAESMNLNVGRLREAVRIAQSVARQAETVVNTVAVDDLTAPSEQDVARLAAELATATEDGMRVLDELSQQQQAVFALHDAHAAAMTTEALAREQLAVLERGLAANCCPTCGSSAGFDKAVAAAFAQVATCEAKTAASEQEHRKAAYEFDVLTKTRREETQKRIADARAKHASATEQVALVREKAAQAKVGEQARERAEQLKSLLERVTEARDRMLAESIAPLRKALTDLSALAPRGLRWDLRFTDDALDIGLLTVDGFVPAESMSSGELFRLTVAMMVARSAVRREPWVGIVFDGFEQVSKAERDEILQILPSIASSGLFDNIILAAAADSGKPDGVNTIELGKW